MMSAAFPWGPNHTQVISLSEGHTRPNSISYMRVGRSGAFQQPHSLLRHPIQPLSRKAQGSVYYSRLEKVQMCIAQIEDAWRSQQEEEKIGLNLNFHISVTVFRNVPRSGYSSSLRAYAWSGLPSRKWTAQRFQLCSQLHKYTCRTHAEPGCMRVLARL